MYSGNVIKSFHCHIGRPVIIQTPEEEFEIPEYRLKIVEEEVEEVEEEETEPLTVTEEGEALVAEQEPELEMVE